MTPEEKGKAYDIVRKKIALRFGSNIAEEIFSEFEEPEDEKIRKAIHIYLDWLDGRKDYAPKGEYSIGDMIAWIERQGEIDKISYEIAEKEKREFVGGGFIKCYADFQDFKEGKTYWLEYLGNDDYIVRSDNLLGKTYHITPCQLYTIFKKQTWREKQGQTFTKKDVDDAYLKGVCDAKQELEKQGKKKSKKVSIWKHWKNGIAGNGDGEPIYLTKVGYTYNLTSCLGFECDYIELSELDNLMLEKQDEQKFFMIQWKGDNLKEVINFTGKDKNFDKWFKSFEEYEKYVHEHNDIFKLFNEDGSHYEVPVGAWIVKTPDGYNVASKAVLKQKLADKVKPKSHEGEWVVSPNGVYWRIDKISNNRYEVTSNTGESSNWNLDTNIYHRFTIQDAKDGDIVVDKSDGTIGIFQSIGHHPDGGSYNDPSYCFLHCRYDDGFFYADFEHGNIIGAYDLIPATKEQRDLLFQKMHEAGYEWDADKKKLKRIKQEPTESPKDYHSIDPHFGISVEDLMTKKNTNDKVEPMYNIGDVLCDKSCTTLDKNSQPNIEILDIRDDMYICNNCTFPISQQDEYELVAKRIEPQTAWGEEDEQYLLVCKNALAKYQTTDKWDASIISHWLENKLKSIKERTTWKPSGEQIKAVKEAACYNSVFSEKTIDNLISLSKQLKKLREE